MPISHRVGPNQAQHSYEEVRNAVFSVLKNAQPGTSGQYNNLKETVAQYFDPPQEGQQRGYNAATLSKYDTNLYLEVFWAMFREGIITLGADGDNPEFPWFRITKYGQKRLNNKDPYFFTDTSDFERLLLIEVPEIDKVTMLYAKEAVQTFIIGATLASSVMIGIAAENTFNTLIDVIESNSIHKDKFTKVFRERHILTRLNEFNRAFDSYPESFANDLKANLDTRFTGIFSLIETFRSQAENPTSTIIDRQQAYVNIQLFVPFARKTYQMIEAFRAK